MNATTIAVDLSKSVFQVSIANRAGRIVERKRLSRQQYERFLAEQPTAEIVMEACGTAHHWARTAREHGHDPYLLHAQYVRPYVRRKAGAAGIVRRLHESIDRVPSVLVAALTPILNEISALEQQIKHLDRQLSAIAKASPDVQRLMTIPGVGVIIATAMVASVADIHSFQRARQFAAWLGLTPREYSSGQTRHLGHISKRGDGYLRMLLTHGARSALLLAHRQAAKGEHSLTSLQRWALDVERRTHHNKATIALANKMARIIWVTWTRAQDYAAR
jgi:transposase